MLLIHIIKYNTPHFMTDCIQEIINGFINSEDETANKLIDYA